MAGPYYKIEGDSTNYQISPSWVVAFVPFIDPEVKPTPQGGSGYRTQANDAMIVVNDAISVTVSSSAASMQDQASITLKIGELDYTKSLSVGDHVFIWMTNWQEDANKIFNQLNSGIPANNFNSGLKFAGKISNLTKSISVSSDGIPDEVVSIAAVMFSELNTSINISSVAQSVLDQTTTSASNKYTELFTKLNPSIMAAFMDSGNRPWRTPDEVTLFMAATFLGNGPTAAMKHLAAGLDADPSSYRDSYNQSMVYPKEAAQILGALDGSGSTPTFFNVINLHLGVESYTPGSFKDDSTLYLPSSVQNKTDGNIRKSPYLKGAFLIVSPNFDNSQVQSVIQQYSNPVCNEIFTCLKYDPASNGIKPTLIHRQIPLSTKNVFKYAGNAKETITEQLLSLSGSQRDHFGSLGSQDFLTSLTQYSNIPRWIMPMSLVTSINIGASSDQKINFIQVFDYSQEIISSVESTAGNDGNAVSLEANIQTSQIAAGNFLFDDDDIKKHGVKASILKTQVGIVLASPAIPKFLAAMQADFQFNNHLKFTGRVTTAGVQEPICVGDNLELDGILYHIEAITHMARIDASGRKMFRTSFTLSNGLVASSLETDTVVYPVDVQQGYFGKTDLQQTKHSNRDALGVLK